MPAASDPQRGEIEVSPEELRFLRGFFRRHTLPYIVLTAVLALGIVWWSSSAVEGDADHTAEDRAATEALRAENQQLRAALSQLSGRVDTVLSDAEGGAGTLALRIEDANRSVRTIESRVAAALERRLDEADRRLYDLENRADAGPSPAKLSDAEAPPAWDVSAILERLYDLEMRQNRVEASSDLGR